MFFMKKDYKNEANTDKVQISGNCKMILIVNFIRTLFLILSLFALAFYFYERMSMFWDNSRVLKPICL